MTAWAITEDGRAYVHHGRHRNEDNAILDLLVLIAESVLDCIEIRLMGAQREPVEVTAEWLMENYEVTRL